MRPTRVLEIFIWWISQILGVMARMLGRKRSTRVVEPQELLIEDYNTCRNIDEINANISVLEEALRVSAGKDLNRASQLNHCGLLLVKRSDINGNVSDIDRAIELEKESLLLTPNDDTERPARLWNLGNAFQSRFESSGNLSDIDSAVSFHEHALRLTKKDHPDIFRRLSNLGISLMRRFENTSNSADIDRAIIFQQDSVSAIPDNHILRSACLINLGNSLQCRFEYFGDTSDIENAIQIQRAALELIPLDDPDRPLCLTNLGISFTRRFEQSGVIADIDNAITVQQEATQITPQNDASRPRRLANLGLSLIRRYEYSGDFIDIDNAIFVQEESLRLTPDNNDFHKSSRLTTLGAAFMKRFERSRNIFDLQKAIAAQRSTLDLTQDDQRNLKASRLINIGASYQRLFEESKDLVDIDDAIKAQKEALSLLEDDHPHKLAGINNLGLSFMRRFEQSKNSNDVDNAINAQEDALKLIPDTQASRATYLNTLGTLFESRFDISRDVADLEKAISRQLESVDLTPKDHAQKPVRLNNLARSYAQRFKLLDDPEDAKKAVVYYRCATMCTSGNPAARLAAAIGFASVASSYDPLQTLEGYGLAIELLPRVTWLGQTILARHVDLASLANLGSEGAAFAISLGRYDLAVQWLEQGRGVVWRQLSQLRLPLQQLSEVEPELAQKLAKVSEDLDIAGSRETPNDMTSTEEEAQRHRRLAEEWDKLIVEVRAVPGFNDFMHASSFAELIRCLPSSGTIIVINAHESRCDALLLSSNSSSVVHVPLPKFSYVKAVELQRNLRICLHDSGMRTRCGRATKEVILDRSQGLESILYDLWTYVAESVLIALDKNKPQSSLEKLPRVWWCTTGPLAFLPFHAAGIYKDGARGKYIGDFVVSSYIPTISVLGVLQKQDAKSQPDFRGILAVSQPNTPFQSPLPRTLDEVRQIQEKFNKFDVLPLVGPMATLKSVSEGMEMHSWVHLACHAVQNVTHPTKSSFCLHDGQLPLSKIIMKSLPYADFAFLSACQTSTGDEHLSEEAVHLAAGMLVAGYRSVIATMWSIRDADGPVVAGEVYSQLLKEPQDMNGPDSANAAYALHHAVNCLKGNIGTSSFFAWVPFIHVGI